MSDADVLPRGTTPPLAGSVADTLADWLAVTDAAAQIGCSKRTIERLARAGKLEQRLRPQAGSPAVAVYNPDDVSRIASERRPAARPFVLGALPTNGNGNGQVGSKLPTSALSQIHDTDDPIRQLFAAALRGVLSPPSPPVAEKVAETKSFLTIPEAAQLTGLSQAYLRRKCQDGSLPAIKDGAWKIRRKDLEQL